VDENRRMGPSLTLPTEQSVVPVLLLVPAFCLFTCELS
jgi:hypothetical protein